MKKSILVLFIFAIILCNVTVVSADPKYKWRFSDPWSRPMLLKGYQFFAEKVSEYTKGQVEIKVFADGLIGNLDDNLKSIKFGDIEMGMTCPYVNVVPGGGLNTIPWAITSYAEFKAAFDTEHGIMHKVMNKAYNEANMEIIYSLCCGGLGLANNVRELKSPADFKNIRFRVSNSKQSCIVLENMGKGTGMTMEILPWSELYNSLSRKVVDGCWTSYNSLNSERMYEVLKYYSNLNFIWDNLQVVINKEIWDGLPKDIQMSIKKAGRDASEFMLKNQIESEANDIEALRKTGIKLTMMTAEQREPFIKSSHVEQVWKEMYTPWLEKAYPNEDMTKKIQEELRKIRKENKGKK